MAAEAANKAVQELKLNVSNFYQDEESRGLIMAEEAAAAFSCTDDDIDYFNNNEKIYECFIGKRLFRLSRSSLLAIALFFTLAVAILMIMIVLLCTFITLSAATTDEDDLIPNDEIVGVINWLHYPVGDMAFRRFNRTHSVMPATVEPHL